MIFNSSKTNGPLSNGRIPLMYSLDVYIKSFGGPKGGFERTPSNPPCLRACDTQEYIIFAAAIVGCVLVSFLRLAFCTPQDRSGSVSHVVVFGDGQWRS